MSAGYEIPEYMIRHPKSLSDPSAGDSEHTFYELEHAQDFLKGLTSSATIRGFEMRVEFFERTITVGPWRMHEPHSVCAD